MNKINSKEDIVQKTKNCECDCSDDCECKDNCVCVDGVCTCEIDDDCECGTDGKCICGKHIGKHHHGDKSDKHAQALKDAEAKYMRALADYQNLEKRLSTLMEDVRRRTREDILYRFLDVLDNIEKAEVFVQDQGLAMIKASLLSAFKSLGVEEIEVLDKEFDPHFAEAIEVVEGEKPNIVVEITRKGYMIENTVLRPAQVKVSK